MTDILRWLHGFNGRLAATPETVRQGEAQLGIRLPPDYVEFITAMNGGEGFVGDNYVILWSVDELPRFNREYNVPEFAPGLVMFGSDGGGEGFGFDLRSQNARCRGPFHWNGLDRCGRDRALVSRVSREAEPRVGYMTDPPRRSANPSCAEGFFRTRGREAFKRSMSRAGRRKKQVALPLAV
jgi:hypothetical protein